MNKDFEIKRVILCSSAILLIIILVEYFFIPQINIKWEFPEKILKKITISQNIAPDRLFINVWRITKNSYIDKTMNNQDWLKWRIRYARRIKTMEDADVAINTMLASLNDPYTKFLHSTAFSRQKKILDSRITGIGVLFDKTGNEVVINHVFNNSSAQAENIKAGDEIIGINGKKASELSIEDITDTIESAKNVELTIKRNNEIITKNIESQSIPIKTMQYEIIYNNIALINLSNVMGKDAVEDFKNILVNTNDAKGIILDLRNNYGGIVANAIQMANFMMKENTIVCINTGKNTKHIYSDNEKIFKDKPVVILTDEKTASAAEILAGTLKDNISAILIGEPTYGKSSIQQIIPVQNNSGVIITTQKYILPNGEDIYNTGLKPDIEIQQEGIQLPEQDEMIKKAVEIINSTVEIQK